MKIKTPKFYVTILQNIKQQNQIHFNQVLSQTFTSGLFFTDQFISSKLLLHSLTNNNLSFSLSLFSQIPNPNIFAYNFMYRAFSQSSTPLKSICLYNSMVGNGGLPDNYSLLYLLKACGRVGYVDKGRELHCLSFKIGFEFDVFVQNALISMYFCCGVVEMSSRVFNFVPVSVRDVVTWNSMISGYLDCGCELDALKVFVKLVGDGFVGFDGVSLISAVNACGRLGLIKVGKQVHGLIVENGFVLDVFLGSSLIDMYAKCGDMEDAKRVFNKMSERNLVCWTSMLVGYSRLDRFKEALDLFREMLLAGVMADAPLSASVISACGHIGALDQGRWLHSYCERNSIVDNLSVRNALVDMYSKCGDIEKALQIFNEMNKRDVFSWTAMISGLAMNANSEAALELFGRMETLNDVRPNEVTFLGVLSACSHGGFVDKGFYYFEAMSRIYGNFPRIEHYGCIVDLLGRANLILEAEKFIRAIPIQLDVVIWRSLLFASQIHGNVEFAELAVRKIEELEPRSSEGGVLLSNVYAKSSRWEQVLKVRKSMVRQNLHKQPGCSFVEVDGVVHEFIVEEDPFNLTDPKYEMNIRLHKVLASGGSDRISFDHL